MAKWEEAPIVTKNKWEEDEPVVTVTTAPKPSGNIFDKILSSISALPGAPMTSKEFKAQTEGMTIPEKLKFTGKEAVKSASEILPFMVTPEAGILQAAAATGFGAGTNKLMQGATPEEAARATLTGGGAGGAIQGAFKALPLLKPLGKQAVGFATGIKLPFAERLIQNPKLAYKVGETGFSDFVKDYANTLSGLGNKAGEETKKIKELIPKDTVIDISNEFNALKNRYNKSNVGAVADDVIAFAKDQKSTIDPNIIKKAFGVNAKKPNIKSIYNKSSFKKAIDKSIEEPEQIDQSLYTFFGESPAFGARSNPLPKRMTSADVKKYMDELGDVTKLKRGVVDDFNFSGDAPAAGIEDYMKLKNIKQNPTDLNYSEAQDVRDLLGYFTRFGEKKGMPSEIAEDLRKAIGNSIDLIDSKYMNSQETYAKTLKLIERASKSAGIPSEDIMYAAKKGRPGVFELPPEFSESKLRGLGNELMLAAGKKEPQSNILNLVEEQAGAPLSERLKDIVTRTEIQEKKESPLGLLSLIGAMGVGGAGLAHHPEIAGGLGIPILIRAILQKNPELLAKIISGAKSQTVKGAVNPLRRLTQGTVQNNINGGQ